ADRKGLPDATARTPDHDALEDLDPLPVAFDDPHMHLDGITGSEIGDVVAQEGLLDEIGRVHGNGHRVYQRPLGELPSRFLDAIVEEIRSVPTCLLARGVTPPPFDLAVVAGEEDLRDTHASELLRACVLGMIERGR